MQKTSSNNFHGKLVSSLPIKFTDIIKVAPDPIFVANLNLLNSNLDILFVWIVVFCQFILILYETKPIL